jgi:hypothetical protein
LIDNFRTIKWETIHLVIEDILILKNKYLKKKKKKKKKEEEKKKRKENEYTNNCLQPLRKIINK